MFQGQRYPYSCARGQANTIVQHVFDLGFFGSYKILFSAHGEVYVSNSHGEKFDLCGGACTLAAHAIKVPY